MTTGPTLNEGTMHHRVNGPTAHPIGLFDSGVGGLSVLQALRVTLPQEDFVYVADSARFPYGRRPSVEVAGIAREMIGLLARRGCKLAVAACGTASAALFHYPPPDPPVPYIGVLEAGARAAVGASSGGRIGIVATDGTVASGAFEHFIRALAGDAAIFALGCSELVEAVELGGGAIEPVTAAASDCIDRLLNWGMDTLLLGCTHFSFVRHLIRRMCGPGVAVVDPAECAAEIVYHRLSEAGMLHPGTDGGFVWYYSTDQPERFSQAAATLLAGRRLMPPEKVMPLMPAGP